jgi:mannose-1-phosphate guanylyltransferase/phosphomannomutase
MKAVILAGSPGTARFPFANYFPKLGLPVANEPLIYHMAHHLRVAGITEIAISVAEHYSLFRALARKVNMQPDLGVTVQIFKEDIPMGTAGSLKNVKGFVKDSSVLVLSSSSFITGHHLKTVIEHHRKHDAGLTVVVEKHAPNLANLLENYKIDSNDRIKAYVAIHKSRDRRRQSQNLPETGKDRRQHSSSAGIYVMSPSAFSMIPDTPGYMDINEQLIPTLYKAGISTKAFPMEGPLPKIIGLLQYHEANRRTLLQPGEDRNFVFRDSRQIADGVWVGENVKIAESAKLVRPVLIGSHCRIGENAEIIGPVALGENCRIEPGAKVKDSFLGSSARVGKDASLAGSLVAGGGVVLKDEKVHRCFALNASASLSPAASC